MTARARRAFAAFVVALLALVATGCAAIDAMQETQQALQDAGFRNASASWYSENGVEYVTVTWHSRGETAETLDERSLAAAGVIWRVAPVYFDHVEVSAVDFGDSIRSRVYSRAELEREFGPRPPGLDRDAGELVNIRATVTTIVVAAVLGLALTTLVIVVLVRRRREPVPAAAWGPWPAAPAGANWPASSWPGGHRPGWSPPPPPPPPPGQWPGRPPPQWPAQPAPPAPWPGQPPAAPPAGPHGATDDPWSAPPS